MNIEMTQEILDCIDDVKNAKNDTAYSFEQDDMYVTVQYCNPDIYISLTDAIDLFNEPVGTVYDCIVIRY